MHFSKSSICFCLHNPLMGQRMNSKNKKQKTKHATPGRPQWEQKTDQSLLVVSKLWQIFQTICLRGGRCSPGGDSLLSPQSDICLGNVASRPVMTTAWDRHEAPRAAWGGCLLAKLWRKSGGKLCFLYCAGAWFGCLEGNCWTHLQAIRASKQSRLCWRILPLWNPKTSISKNT